MSETKTIDAKNKKLGRLASKVAQWLQDKHLPTYNPSKPGETEVVVKNGDKVEVSGKKEMNKTYRKHTQRPGSLKEETFETLQKKSPEKIIIHAVKNMLPKNKLRDKRLKRLTIKTSEDN